MKHALKCLPTVLNQPTNSGSLKYEIDEWLTTNDVAANYKLTFYIVRNMTSNGQLPFYKLGNRNRYRRSEIDAILFLNKRGANNEL